MEFMGLKCLCAVTIRQATGDDGTQGLEGQLGEDDEGRRVPNCGHFFFLASVQSRPEIFNCPLISRSAAAFGLSRPLETHPGSRASASSIAPPSTPLFSYPGTEDWGKVRKRNGGSVEGREGRAGTDRDSTGDSLTAGAAKRLRGRRRRSEKPPGTSLFINLRQVQKAQENE